MYDIIGVALEAELTYRRERIAEDIRRAGGGRGRGALKAAMGVPVVPARVPVPTREDRRRRIAA